MESTCCRESFHPNARSLRLMWLSVSLSVSLVGLVCLLLRNLYNDDKDSVRAATMTGSFPLEVMMSDPAFSAEWIAAASDKLTHATPQEILRWAVRIFHPKLT